ncbi:MAG: hypothetical protein HYU69_08190 [Bacteroidetes bacterium]|nr:hypothetical protein [Bacteroidota bacterium]
MEKVVRITSFREQSDDADIDYWLSKTPQQRIAALTKLVIDYCYFKNIPLKMAKIVTIKKLSEQDGDL